MDAVAETNRSGRGVFLAVEGLIRLGAVLTTLAVIGG